MKFTATDRFSLFSISWDQCRTGAPSLDHHRVMPMQASEAAVFARLQREGKTMEQTERWKYEVQA